MMMEEEYVLDDLAQGSKDFVLIQKPITPGYDVKLVLGRRTQTFLPSLRTEANQMADLQTDKLKLFQEILDDLYCEIENINHQKLDADEIETNLDLIEALVDIDRQTDVSMTASEAFARDIEERAAFLKQEYQSIVKKSIDNFIDDLNENDMFNIDFGITHRLYNMLMSQNALGLAVETVLVNMVKFVVVYLDFIVETVDSVLEISGKIIDTTEPLIENLKYQINLTRSTIDSSDLFTNPKQNVHRLILLLKATSIFLKVTKSVVTAARTVTKEKQGMMNTALVATDKAIFLIEPIIDLSEFCLINIDKEVFGSAHYFEFVRLAASVLTSASVVVNNLLPIVHCSSSQTSAPEHQLTEQYQTIFSTLLQAIRMTEQLIAYTKPYLDMAPKILKVANPILKRFPVQPSSWF